MAAEYLKRAAKTPQSEDARTTAVVADMLARIEA